MELPPAAVPPGALDTVPADARLAFALPEGTVLTQAHLDPRGPAAGLAPGLRALPIPMEAGWTLLAGGRVDVWVQDGSGGPARLVARSCPVLAVAEPEHQAPTALIGLPAAAVGEVARGIGLGAVLLAHAPPAPGQGHC